MTTDPAPTYIIAFSRPGGAAHLSADGRYTLCHWVIRPYWQQSDRRVPLVSLWLAGWDICAQCDQAAQRAAP